MAARSKARKRALDILFEAELRGEPVLDVLAERIAMASPPVSAYKSMVSELPAPGVPMSVRMPPDPWNPIVSAGATGRLGGAAGACLKLNAPMRSFCLALSLVSGGRPHRCCMNDRIETLVVCW